MGLISLFFVFINPAWDTIALLSPKEVSLRYDLDIKKLKKVVLVLCLLISFISSVLLCPGVQWPRLSFCLLVPVTIPQGQAPKAEQKMSCTITSHPTPCFSHTEGKTLHQKTDWLTLLRYSLYYGSLEPNPQCLWGLPVVSFYLLQTLVSLSLKWWFYKSLLPGKQSTICDLKVKEV